MVKTYKLYTNSEIPAIGYGTWEIPKQNVSELLTYAIDEVGYRHIDCAHVYQNEAEIGQALRKLKTSRNQLFITSKLWNTFHRPEYVAGALETTLNNLQLDYLDLYLIHWPTPFQPGKEIFPKDENGNPKIDDVDYVQTYKQMEELVKTGKVKHIGVSNFTVSKLQRILKECKIKPAVNQVEMHPYLTQPELIDFCNKHEIHITAYSPLGSSSNKLNLLEDNLLKQIASKYNTSVGTVLISWAASRTSVIPRSTKKERIKSNFDVIELKKEDIQQINTLNKNARCIGGFNNEFSD